MRAILAGVGTLMPLSILEKSPGSIPAASARRRWLYPRTAISLRVSAVKSVNSGANRVGTRGSLAVGEPGRTNRPTLQRTPGNLETACERIGTIWNAERGSDGWTRRQARDDPLDVGLKRARGSGLRGE